MSSYKDYVSTKLEINIYIRKSGFTLFKTIIFGKIFILAVMTCLIYLLRSTKFDHDDIASAILLFCTEYL